jgi:hypothetical protein
MEVHAAEEGVPTRTQLPTAALYCYLVQRKVVIHGGLYRLLLDVVRCVP